MTYWNSNADEAAFITFQSLMKYNDGLFKSQKQAKFILEGGLVKTWDATLAKLLDIKNFEDTRKLVKQTFGIILPDSDHRLIHLEGWVDMAGYGSRGRRKVGYLYLMDFNGIVEKYKLHYKYPKNAAIQINPEATEREWFRSVGEIPGFESPEVIQMRIDDEARKANEYTKHLGNIKQRMDFEGTVKQIKPMGFKQVTYNSGYEQFKTMVVTDEGDTIITYTTLEGAKEGDRIKFKATVVAHETYKFVKQTIVNRAKLI